jgi:hypothetical protein
MMLFILASRCSWAGLGWLKSVQIKKRNISITHRATTYPQTYPQGKIMKRLLVACEHSGVVGDAFTRTGLWKVITCDLKPSDSTLTEHYQGDVRDLYGQPRGYDMMIAFPPCTDLAVSGAAHFAKKRADGRQQDGINFFMRLWNAPIDKICIENPVGIMSTEWREPDQIVQPYYFGDQATKTTCLWLKGLRPLVHIPHGDMFDKPTHCDPGEQVTLGNGKTMSKWFYETSCLPQSERAEARSRFWPGIANAMAEQWQ